jgi:hypothetical protein
VPEPVTVWVNSLEDDLGSVVRPRLEVAGADLGRKPLGLRTRPGRPCGRPGPTLTDNGNGEPNPARDRGVALLARDPGVALLCLRGPTALA